MKKLQRLILLCTFLASQTAVAEPPGKGMYWGDAKHNIEGAMAAEVQERYPEKLKKLIGSDKAVVYAIDLDKDGKSDFILRYVDTVKTCFIKSDLSTVSCEKLGYADAFRYYWFLDLAGDPLLELVSLVGDEDYSEYYLYHFDHKTWKMNRRLKIAPVIFSESSNYRGIYWGYPWDITKIVVSKSRGATRISCAASDPRRDHLDEEMENALFVAFKGLPTQGDPVGAFNYLDGKFKFMDYHDLSPRYQAVGN